MDRIIIMVGIALGVYFLLNRASNNMTAELSARKQQLKDELPPIINPVTGRERPIGGNAGGGAVRDRGEREKL